MGDFRSKGRGKAKFNATKRRWYVLREARLADLLASGVELDAAKEQATAYAKEQIAKEVRVST